MKKAISLICVATIAFVSFGFIIGIAFGQTSVVNKGPTNQLINTEYSKFATFDIRPAVGYHNGSPVRVRVDTIDSISAFVSVSTGVISNNYAVAATTMRVGSVANKPKVGQTFNIKNDTKVYTVASFVDLGNSSYDVTFTPALAQAVTTNTPLVFITYYTQIGVQYGGVWYDERPYNEIGSILLGYGWGTGTATPYVYTHVFK